MNSQTSWAEGRQQLWPVFKTLLFPAPGFGGVGVSLRWPAVGEVRNLSCVSSGEEPVLHGDKAGENEAHHL